MPATTYPTRFYTARNDGTPSGEYTDHRNQAVQEHAYELRITRHTYNDITAALGLQHWHWAQRAVEQYALRNNIEMPRSRTRQLARQAAEQVQTSLRRFGIEIEFNRGNVVAEYDNITQRRAIVSTLTGQGVNATVTGYTHEVTGYWKMTTDATVSGGEMVSPIMDGSRDSIREVQTVISAIKEHGGTTGRRVGMHVHHDLTDFDMTNMIDLVKNLRHTQQAWMSYVPNHRHDGSSGCGANRITESGFDALTEYVQAGRLLPARARTRENRNHGCPVTRYSTFNFNSVLTYGTVEFRLLGNTLNITKVRAWVETGQALMRFTKAGHTFDTTVTAQQMIDRLIADGGLSRWAGRQFMAQVARRNPAAAAA